MKLPNAPLMPEEAAARIAWFVRLRWLAAAGVLVFVTVGHFLLHLQFEVWAFVFIGVLIALYNAGFLLVNHKLKPVGKWADRFASTQVAIDVLVLTVLMHFGGGIENPFISYFLFHAIIAAILLPRRKAQLHILLASVCIAVLATAEFIGILPHHDVGGLLSGDLELYNNWKFVTVTVFAAITTLCVAVFLATSIVQRLRERERQLSRANEALAEQDRIKSQYVMRVAHDLAGPAAMITSCLGLVTQGFISPGSDKAMDMVRRAESKSKYLGHLIKDLLSLSRIKAAREIPKTTIDLPNIINQVMQELQMQVTNKNLTIEQKLPVGLPMVYGNAEAVQEVFGNLLTNAVKYTLVGGRVEVSASDTGDEVVVRIHDNGVGIPDEALPHVFEEFYRADNVKAEAVEGTGLGLSIVKQILNTHDGRIWVESELGKGTTFSLTLPVVGGSHEQQP